MGWVVQRGAMVAFIGVAMIAGCSRLENSPLKAVARESSVTNDLATFRLQTACAREARAWVNERLRNEDYKPGPLAIFQIEKTHYSLEKHGCYAVVDARSDISTGRYSAINVERRLFLVDGYWRPMAEITAGTTNIIRGLYGVRSVLVHDMKLCVVGVRTCSSFEEWELWTAPYLEN